MRPQSNTSCQQFVRVCECGCGQPTLLPPRASTEKGWVRGQPLRFLNNHHTTGANNHRWHGGQYQDAAGYCWVKRPDHPYADARGYMQVHRLVVEARIGRYLTPADIVHHCDLNPANNADDNLVLTNRADHARLHGATPNWSRDCDCCIDCGTTERRHEGFGRCKRCYQHWRYTTDPAYRQRKLAAQKAARL